MNTEIITPSAAKSDVPGVLFYITADGKQTAISRTGLNILLGNAPGSDIFGKKTTLNKVATGSGNIKDCPKELKSIWGKVFAPNIKGSDGAILITEEAATEILLYYAYTLQKPAAIHNCKLFVRKGFNTWVKEITGFAIAGDTAGLQSLMGDVLHEVKNIRAEVKELRQLKVITTTVYPGLDDLNTNLGEIESPTKILSSNALYTVTEWLALKNIVLDKSKKASFARLCSDTFTSMTGDRPPVKYDAVTKQDGSTKHIKKGKGYRLIDFHILDVAYQHLLNKLNR
ncbi:MAG: hypothetical protein F6J98_02085 [Moorea sp. SIO4G2]|nr:hypothetical protein [Moorena sp. SIO4G2]